VRDSDDFQFSPHEILESDPSPLALC